MRTDVIEFFQNLPESEPEQFNKAFQLYGRSPGKNLGAERKYNAGGYTKQNLANLLYDLSKLHTITDLEKLPVEKEEVFIAENDLPVENQLEVVKMPESFIQDNKQEEPLKLRDQYPFLNDPDCPNELKILVSDKLTHYNAYQEAHDILQKVTSCELQLSEEDNTKAAAAAAYHFEQSENIAKELDYYAAEKKVLGEHPIFAQLALQREVDEMTQDDLLKYKTQTASFISKKNKKIRESQSEEVKAGLQKDIDDRNAKLALVDKRLGVESK
jgi:hypothetical protein